MTIDELISRLQEVRSEAGYDVEVYIDYDITEQVDVDATDIYYDEGNDAEFISPSIAIRLYKPEGERGERKINKSQKLFHVYSKIMNAETYEDFYEQDDLIVSFCTKEEAERFIDEQSLERMKKEGVDDDERYVYTTEIPDDLECSSGMRKIIERRSETMRNKCYKSVIEFDQFRNRDGSWVYEEYLTHFLGYYIEEGTLG